LTVDREEDEGEEEEELDPPPPPSLHDAQQAMTVVFRYLSVIITQQWTRWTQSWTFRNC